MAKLDLKQANGFNSVRTENPALISPVWATRTEMAGSWADHPNTLISQRVVYNTTNRTDTLISQRAPRTGGSSINDSFRAGLAATIDRQVGHGSFLPEAERIGAPQAQMNDLIILTPDSGAAHLRTIDPSDSNPMNHLDLKRTHKKKYIITEKLHKRNLDLE